MPVYGYQCGRCYTLVEAVRAVDGRDDAPCCPRCPELPMSRIIGYGINIIASPWAASLPGGWPVGMGEKDKTEHQKRWERDNDSSWNGEAPSKSDFAVGSARDVFDNLSHDQVQAHLAGALSQED